MGGVPKDGPLVKVCSLESIGVNNYDVRRDSMSKPIHEQYGVQALTTTVDVSVCHGGLTTTPVSAVVKCFDRCGVLCHQGRSGEKLCSLTGDDQSVTESRLQLAQQRSRKPTKPVFIQHSKPHTSPRPPHSNLNDLLNPLSCNK
jgi:hypothetical protein